MAAHASPRRPRKTVRRRVKLSRESGPSSGAAHLLLDGWFQQDKAGHQGRPITPQQRFEVDAGSSSSAEPQSSAAGSCWPSFSRQAARFAKHAARAAASDAGARPSAAVSAPAGEQGFGEGGAGATEEESSKRGGRPPHTRARAHRGFLVVPRSVQLVALSLFALRLPQLLLVVVCAAASAAAVSAGARGRARPSPP